MPTSLINSLTHHFPLSNAARKLSATNRAERLPQRERSLIFFWASISLFVFLGKAQQGRVSHRLSAPSAWEVELISLVLTVNSASQRTRASVEAVILLLQMLCGVLKGVDGGSVWEKPSGPSPKKKQAGVAQVGCTVSRITWHGLVWVLNGIH